MSSAQPAPTGRVGEVIGGRWTLERVLGEGATAVVYAARDSAGARAAVKVLRPEVASSPDVSRRFLREGGAAGRIAHPGIVRVLEQAGDDPASAYLVMELLDGETLADRLTRGAPLQTAELFEVFDQLLDVLAEAHAHGIVHRDLKPANVFLTRDGRVKLLDFGLARMMDPTLGEGATRAGVAVGTVAYMAPEQALGRHHEIDGRSDLFSVGAMLFRILSGRRIHEAANDAELLLKMASDPAPPLASVAPNVASGLCAIVDLALGFTRDARYANARSMQQDLREAQHGREPPAAVQARVARDRATVLAGKAAADSTAKPPESSPAEALVGQVLAERYRIEALIGSGGMGAVYRAQHVHMRKAVAVKVLHREMTMHAEVVARFEREAVAAARIDHPNVVAARDFGKLDDGSFYLVLEFVEGRSLRELIREHKRARRGVPSPRALAITRQIAAALAAAHAAGIVHRDLKPENVMLVEGSGGRELVKVLDFGIAKLSADDAREAPALTRMGAVFGTPEYMSPEQALGQAVDRRADLYTLGIMLYEMLAGATPFASDEMVVTLTRQMTEAPAPLPASVEPEINQLVLSLLEKEPARRVQTAAELVERLDRLLGTASSVQPMSAGLGGASRTELETGATVLGVASLPGAAAAMRPSFGQTLRTVKRWSQKDLRLLGRRVPIWALGTLLLAVVAAALFLGGHEKPAQDKGPAGPGLTERLGIGVDEELVALRKRAFSGERAALAELEKRPSDERKAADWQALAHGYCELGDFPACVKNYDHLLTEEPKLLDNQDTVADLRRAALTSVAGEEALELMAKLGGPGIDLLFTASEDLSKSSSALAAQARQLLSSDAVRSKASPALLVLIDLREAKGCRAYKDLLPRVTEDADRRAVPILERLTRRRGCGFFRRRDCYPCLRGDDSLKDALAAADKRAAPRVTQ